MTKKLLLPVCMLLLFATSWSQQKSQSQSLMHINQFLGSAESRAASNPDAVRAAQLIFEVQPTVYISGSQVNSFGDGAKVIHTNVGSLDNLVNVPAEAKNSAEALFIKIESPSQISMPIDLSILSGFPQMKFVYILSTVDSVPGNITGAVTNHSSYIVFYNIEKAN